MTLSESLKKWEQFGLEQRTEICELHYNDLIVMKGNLQHGLVATYKDITEGRTSQTPNEPLQVCWIREENKFLVVDGYHRLLEALMEGELSYLCEIDWSGYTLRWQIPSKENRAILKGLK
jgi:hypothetical protein